MWDMSWQQTYLKTVAVHPVVILAYYSVLFKCLTVSCPTKKESFLSVVVAFVSMYFYKNAI